MATREEFIYAAEYARDFAEKNPSLFETKRRCPAIWKRVGFWVGGVILGAFVNKLITGDATHPAQMIFGMLIAATFIYFDPPPIQTIHKFKAASGTEARRAETPQDGSVHDGPTSQSEGTPK